MIQFLKDLLESLTTALIWVRSVLFARSRLKASFKVRIKALRYDFTPDEYLLFGLSCNNHRRYISQGQTVKARQFDAPFNSMLNDLVVCHEVIGQHLPTQKVFGWVGAKGQITNHSADCDMADGIFSLLGQGDVLFKWGQYGPLEAAKPTWLVKQQDGQLWLNGQVANRRDIEELLTHLDGYCALEHVETHPYVRQWGELEEHELEILVARDPRTGQGQVIRALQHVWSDIVNNQSVEWVANIDLETGKLYPARSTSKLGELSQYERDGIMAPIAGVEVPGWAKIREALEVATRSLPYIRLLTYRAVVTNDDFVVTGAYSLTNTTRMQLWDPLADTVFGQLAEVA